MPARPYQPKDKAQVEVGVQLVERWILAKLSQQTFFSLAELNHSIRALLTERNPQPGKLWPGNRRQGSLNQLDQPALSPLPKPPYQFVDIKTARVNIDYCPLSTHNPCIRLRIIASASQLKASPQSIDYQHPRGLKPAQMASLLRCDWIHKAQNRLLTGPCGI